MSFGRAKDDKENEKTVPVGQFSVSQASKPDAFLGKGCKIVGNLFFAGSVEIDCCIEGEVNGERINIGENANLSAKIAASEVTVRGQITGDIVATKRIALRRPAKVLGNITAPAVSIEEGVTFEGKCVMGAAASAVSGARLVGDSKGSEVRPSGIISIVPDKDKVA